MYLGMLRGGKQLKDRGLPFNFVKKNGSKADRVLPWGKKGLGFFCIFNGNDITIRH